MSFDFRKQWLKERVLTFLNEENNYILFDNLLYRKEGVVSTLLDEFLDKPICGSHDHKRSVVFFYKTYYDKTVLEEVDVQEEVAQPAQTLEPEPESVIALTTEPKRKKSKGNIKKKRRGSKKLDLDEVNESSALHADPDEPDPGIKADLQERDGGEATKEDDGLETQSMDDDGDKKTKGRKDSKSKKSKKGRRSPVTLVEEAPKLPTPPPEYVTVKKVVTKVVPAPQLHCHFGAVNGNKIDINQQYAYFIRQCYHPVPLTDTWEEAVAEMPVYFLVGSISGNFLPGLRTLIKQVFMSLISCQFQDPLLELKRKSRTKDDSDGTKQAHYPPTMEAFCRPSDFWRMALKMQQEFAAEEAFLEQDRVMEVVPVVKRRSLEAQDSQEEPQTPDSETEEEVTMLRPLDIEESVEGAIDLDELVAAHLGMPLGEITSTIRRKSSTASATSRRTSALLLDDANAECEPFKVEMLKQLESLVKMIDWTQNHLTGDISLPVPNLPELTSKDFKPELLSQNEEVVSKLEEAVKLWNERLSKNLERITSKKPVGDGPIAEYTHWHELEAELSILQEQLNTPMVLKVINLLSLTTSEHFVKFKDIQADLKKHFVETQDNVRFLSTILCHFKVLMESDSLGEIKNCLYDLMEGLRIIWYLSVYYSKDDNMAILLERIKWALCFKVENLLNVSKLFNQDLRKVEKLTNEAVDLLVAWRQSYLDTRMRIETTGTSVRWEFNKEMLFSESDYMAAVADDLNHVSKVMLEFHNIFGAELKSIISDPVQIDAVVKKVESMCHPIVKADFEIFSKDSKEHWENIMQWFENQVSAIENEAKYFINESFTLLRSSEEALEILQKFNYIDTRATIQSQLKTKYEPILHQFMKEVTTVENIFQSQKASPPLLRNYPPVAGSIFWERFLFHRIKRPILAFQKVDAITALSFKNTVFQEYLVLVKQMKEFEDEKYNNWSKKVVPLVETALTQEVIELVESDRFVDLVLNEQSKKAKENNLRMISMKHLKQLRSRTSKTVSKFKSHTKQKKPQKSKLDIEDALIPAVSPTSMSPLALTMKWLTGSQSKADVLYSTKYGTINPKARMKRIHTLAWGEFIEDALLIELKLGIHMNFTESLFEVISEAKLMEQLGFKLPNLIRTLIAIEIPLFDAHRIIKNMTHEYCALVNRLDVPQLLFAKDHLRDVENQLHPGLVRINWSSLQIKSYAEKVLLKINNLKNLVMQMDSCSEKLDQKMSLIGAFDLFSLIQSTHRLGTICCFDFFEKLEAIQVEKMSKILNLYKLLGPILMKLESTVLQTNSGKSPFMIFYYTNCEKKIFHTFIDVCLQNLRGFDDFLNGKESVIMIEALLGPQNVYLQPTFVQIYNLIILTVRRFMENFKKIPRWMHGTCLLCPEVFSEDKEFKHLFSFYDDLIGVKAINDLLLQIKLTAHRLVEDLSRYLSKWRKYQSVWLLDKDANVEKFAAQNPKFNAYEEKFSFYSDMLAELNAIETFTDIQCIRIDLTKLMDSLKTHLVLWKNKLGEKLANDTRKVMNNFQEKMLELKSSLETGVSEVVSFKIVLQAIADIKLLIVDAELIFEEVDERYHIMSLQNITVSAEDRQLFSSLKSDWNSLLDLSMYRKLSLEPAKSVFAQITRNDIMKFGESTEVFTQHYYEEGPGSIKQNLKLGEGIIVEWRTLFASMNSERDEMLKVEKLFDLPKFSYDSYLAAFAHFQGMEVIYELYHRQKAAREQWGKSSWLNFNSQILYDGIEVFLAEFRHLPEAVQSLEAGGALLTTMLQFKESIPLFVKLKNEAIRSRHWKELMNRTGKHFDISTEAFNLLCVFEMELYDHKAACLEIINNALKELAIELSIKDIVTTWEAMQLQIVKYEGNNSDCDNSYMLGDVADILLLLDDHTMMLQTMANSDFVGSFLQTIQIWEMNLSNVSEVLDEWVSCQSLWLYLAVGVFSNSILSEQLSEEKVIFDQVDQTYRKIMIEALKNLRVLDQCLDSSTRIPEFHDLFLKLEVCRKALDQILDRKRMMFPRFFFLSDDELLAILGTLKPFHIKNFLIKLFDNIQSWDFNESSEGKFTVSAVVSNEGEAIKLKFPQQAVGFLEEWMKSVTDEIRKTSWHLIKKAVYDYGKVKQPRAEWILNFQGMIIYAANSVWWTEEVENVFSNINKGEVNAMKDYLSIQNEQLEELAAFLDHLSPLDRRKISNMIVVDIHSRDVIETFVQNNVNSNEDFEWKKQLRFYWEKPLDNFIIKQCSTVISYGLEYSGLNERLVITPLSDRFYLTVTQALYFHLGASPVGFAGAGKSETVRDLAKTLGLLCIVIHCTGSMEFGVFQLWLKGLCQCGAWGVFENLSQVNSSTLSALSIRIQCILSASKNNLKKLNLDGQVLDFKDSVNLFVTVNPTSNSSFPEHLKSLFRPVACTMPDLEFISYVLLYSKGFISAKILSKKITVLFKLAAVKLSQQLQYDFSIRTLKLTIVTAAAKKEDVTDETVLIVQALKDVFWPKLVESDVQLFNELLKDIFAEVYYHLTVDKDLLAVIKMSLQENNYILVDKQIEKCAQLYYMLQIHHACMLVGPSGSGKSVIFQTLEKIQKNLRLSGKIHPVNPKSCSVDELFGCVDSRGVWRDGVLSSIFRTINAANYSKERKYILFDGEIDSTWVENLSSVIDQTKLLTLGNGERIQLLSHCALLFEVSHLQNTPPAIVSRFGLIYVCPSDLGYEAVWERWLNKFCHDENIKSLREFSKKYLKPILKFILAEKHDFEERRLPVQTVLPLSSLNMVTQFCFIMDVLLQNIKSKKHKIPDEILEALFIEGLYASFGVIITVAERNAFDSFVKNLTGFTLLDRDKNNLIGLQSLPSEKSLYDCYVDVEKKCWSAWEDTISPSAPSGTFCPKFCDIFIPTADSSKLLSYLQRINEHYFKGKPQLELKNPTVLISEGSTYKTAIMNNFLRNLSCDEFAQLKISFSARTNSLVVQSCLETMISKRTKNIFGPAKKKLVCFFDDLSTPKVDEHGCQQVIAFLRSLYEKHGFYHQGENIQWRNVKDLGYYAAMCCGHNGSGVDPRFLSLVYVVNVTQLSDLIVTNIFSTILQNHTRDFGKDIQAIVPDIIRATSEMFQILRTEAPPIPHKFHYAFSLRDFSKVVAGLCLTTSRIFTTAQQFIRVWRNEFTRVTCDRLITKQDNSLIQSLFEGVIEKYFPSSLNYVIRDPLLFGDFRNAVIGDANPRRDYEDLLDYDAVFHLFEEVLLKYNEQNALMRMILFNDALEHLTRLQRIFRLSDGHVLFLGPGGIGKQSLIRLAAFTAGCEVFGISYSLSYSLFDFEREIKQVLISAGVSTKNFILFLDTTQIIDEGCYEILNEIITSCIRPTFFDQTDKETVVSQLRNDPPNSTDEDIWSKFLINCVENIHIAMTVSLETNELRRLCQNYPGLAKSMYLNWGFSWPAEAFSIIANTFLSHQDLLPDDYVEGVIEQLVYAHTTIDKYVMEYRVQLQKQVYVTCSSFFNCIHTLLDLLDERHSFLCTEQENLKNGIAKIKEVFEHTEELKAKLAIHSFMISEKAEEIQKTLEDINAAEKVGEEVKEEVRERQKEMEVISKELIDEKCEVEEMSSKIAPSLVAAKETLRHLDQEDISEICSYVAPPEVVQNIGECVAILLGTKEISWKRAKSIMSEPDFVSDLINLDCNIISQKQQQACRVHMKPAKKMETLKDISKAGYTLYLLIEEILAYCMVFKEIKTKNSKISRLEDELKVAQNYISQLNYKMKEANIALCLLHDSYEKSIAEKEKLQIEKGEIEIKMKAADELVDVLNPRHTSWTQALDEAKISEQQLVGDCLICALFLSYAGPFNQEFRRIIIYSDWLSHIASSDIPISQPFIPEKILSPKLACSENFKGILMDEFQVENQILIRRARQSPLCIDPQNQAFNWICENEKNLQITSFADPNHLTLLKNAFKDGGVLLFEEVGMIDPIIYNILDKKLVKNVNQSLVSFDGKLEEFSSNLKLYFTSLKAFPNFSPIVFTKTAVIDFSITRQAVVNQLLSLTSKLVDSSLEEERTQLLHDGLSMERAAKKFGDTFLLTLLKSSERILDHAQEIEPLLILNHQICETQDKLEAVKRTLKSVEEKRTAYAPLAEEISPIFFIFIEASLIENIYQYSLETFLNVFKSRLKSVFINQPQDDVPTCCQAMLFELYKFGCSSVFKDHELFFSYQMAIKIDHIRSSISQSALNLVRRRLQSYSCEKESPVTWLSKEDWMRILKLSESFPQKLYTLPADIVENSAVWESIQNSGDFISVFPSDHWVRKLAPFEELMVLLCISPGRICHSVERYVSTILGTEFLMPPTVDLADAFMNSTASTPILVIHSPDLDPSLTVAKLFKTCSSNVGLNFTTTRSELGESTLRLFDEMSVAGGWLAIQCWNKLDVVTNLGNQLHNRTPHPDFRLWIMINCASSFPLKLLRNCIKVCYEPTTDLKSNLVNTYSQLGSELSLSDHVAFSQVLYVLAFFHAVVQERGKYGRIGWNLPYEFSRTDFDLTVFTVATYFNEATEVGQNLPWSTIKYLINEILYGGRVVQESDKIILHTIVEEYFGDFLFDQFQSFHFFQDDLVDYDLPFGDCAEDFLRSIKNLPNQNHPGVFGLDKNIEVKQVADKARKMWATLRESEEEKMSASTEKSLISQVRDLSGKLIRPFDVVKIRSSYKMVVTPSATVLLQELSVFNLLLKVMSSTLTSLQKALDGETSLSEYLEQISVNILSNRIPDEWCKYSPMNSKSLSGWIQHFERRKLQFLDWSVRGDPVVIWLSGLFTPRAYIIALLQTACQKKSWSLDRSSFYTIVTNLMHESEVEERPEIGCFVQGIYIEGGRWDSSRECLAECRPGTLIEEMPILMIRPVEVSKLKLENTLRTPVYVTSERRSVENRGVVFEAGLKLDKHHSFWILSGVCLILNDDST